MRVLRSGGRYVRGTRPVFTGSSAYATLVAAANPHLDAPFEGAFIELPIETFATSNSRSRFAIAAVWTGELRMQSAMARAQASSSRLWAPMASDSACTETSRT